MTDQLVIAGTPDSVAEEILEFQEETGDLGELVYAGMDWVDPDLAQRSMEPIATKVMPQVNAHTRPGGRRLGEHDWSAYPSR